MKEERIAVRIAGVVQGVGFRTFVHDLATLQYMDLLIKCNVGYRERFIRMMFGSAASLGAFFARDKKLRVGLGALGFAGVITAWTRYSPLNQLLGRDECQAA